MRPSGPPRLTMETDGQSGIEGVLTTPRRPSAAALAVTLLLLSCVPRPPAAAPPPSPPPPAHREPELVLPVEPLPTPPATRPGPPPPPPPAPAIEPDPIVIPARIRVGLATDLDEITLPCCGTDLEVTIGDLRTTLDEPSVVRPAAALDGVASYRVQVAALKDEAQASGLAAQLRRRLGVAGDASFDAERGLYRVRVGHYPNRSEAEGLIRELQALGMTDVWVVQEGGSVEDPAFLVFRDGRSRRLAGRWLAVRSAQGFVRIRGQGYRGRILVFLNDRGKLNLINELPVDDYLRGVVPREMGPEIYDELEVLKAQTVAARTYTLRNLGEFAGEGYDICATPRCQVYGGLDVEHRLSNQAIEETAGQVLVYDGELADTLYSATCGGHTEDVEVVFPLKREPYLRGVPCAEAGDETLASRRQAREPLASALMRQLLPPAPTGDELAVAAGRFQHLALLAGLEPPPDRLRSLQPVEVKRYVASVFDLSLEARLLLPAEELRGVLASPPPARWGPAEQRLARRLDGDGVEPLREGDLDELLFDLSRALRVVRVLETAYVGQNDNRLEVRQGSKTESWLLSPTLVTYAADGGRSIARDLLLAPGDRLRVYLRRSEVLAVEHPAHHDELRVANLPPRSWSRFRSRGEVRAAVRELYPGFELRSFEILARGVSGRVARLRLLGVEGKELFLEGLQVRWTLGLPDTLFTVRHLNRDDGDEGWLFEGRGWGHGVGLCQVGAFGMAQRGREYEDILDYYYTGVRLVHATERPSAVVTAGGAR